MARKLAVSRATSVKRRTTRQQEAVESDEPSFYPSKNQRVNTAPLVPQNETQKRYINAIKNFQLTIATGPAGTGKTYIAGSYAAMSLQSQEISRIIITRPSIEVGQSLGFLPGELEEKYAPYLAPFREIMIERMGRSQYDYALKAEKISPQPLGYMRGSTFKDAVVILDEAQNTTPAEMKMFLTRIGENCTVIINGDIQQCDLSGPSGLEDAVRRIRHIPAVKLVEFTEDDIVRSGLVKEILMAYRS